MLKSKVFIVELSLILIIFASCVSATLNIPVYLDPNPSLSQATVTVYGQITEDGSPFMNQPINIYFQGDNININSSSQWASGATGNNSYGQGWDFIDMIGAPDVPFCADSNNAWASSGGLSDSAQLNLTYDLSVYATGVNIHETYVASFISKIEFQADNGTTYTLWQGTDTTTCDNWLNITSTVTPALGKKVILYTNGAAGSYEEIDAVQLIGYNLKTNTDDNGNYSLDFTAPVSNGVYPVIINATGYAEQGSEDLIVNDAVPFIDFVSPTPDNNTVTSDINQIINVSITNTSALSQFIWNWNGTNYSLYDSNTIVIMNFNNISDLGENSTNIVDISPYGNNGTVTGATLSSSGKYNTALSFDGTGDYVTLPNLGLSGNVAFSVSFWTNPSSSSSIEEPFSFGNSWGNGHFEVIRNWPSANQLSIAAGGGAQLSTTYPADSVWTNVVITSNSTDLFVYYNGVLNKNVTYSLSVGNTNYRIGCSGPQSCIYVYRGLIDEVMVWNRSLSVAEVQELYSSNINKYSSTNWSFLANKTSLSIGSYTYQAFAKNTLDNLNQTDLRYLAIIDKWTSTQLNPVSDGNVSQNQTFTFSTRISCATFCGNITASLNTDPPAEIEYIGNGDFETGDINNWNTGGNANWAANSTYKYSGTYSARSGVIGDWQYTQINQTVILSNPQTLNFWWKVSSESGYDYLGFCYDQSFGSGTCIRGNGNVTPISGSVDWTKVSLNVSAGTHTLLWYYAKDSSAVSGDDAGYIDNISLIETISNNVSTTAGTTPFYTTSSNPQNSTNTPCLANVQSGSSCDLNWTVNSTGNLNSSYIFYVSFSSNVTDIPTMNSTQLNLTIVESTTTTCNITLTLSPTLSSSIKWSTAYPNLVNLSADGNNNEGVTDYSALLTVSPVDASCGMDLYTKADADLSNGSDIISLSNEKFSYSSTNSSVPSDIKSSLTTSYNDNKIANNVTNGTNIYLKYFLNISTSQGKGQYTNTVYFKAVKSGTIP